MNGKEKCLLMKRIRQEIALKNNIKFETTDCNSLEECNGHCPKCDAEAANLMRALWQKEAMGQAIRIDVSSYLGLESMTSDSEENGLTYSDAEETPGDIDFDAPFDGI